MRVDRRGTFWSWGSGSSALFAFFEGWGGGGGLRWFFCVPAAAEEGSEETAKRRDGL